MLWCAPAQMLPITQHLTRWHVSLYNMQKPRVGCSCQVLYARGVSLCRCTAHFLEVQASWFPNACTCRLRTSPAHSFHSALHRADSMALSPGRPAHLPQRAVLAVVVCNRRLVLVLVRKRAPALAPPSAGLLLPAAAALSGRGLPSAGLAVCMWLRRRGWRHIPSLPCTIQKLYSPGVQRL